MSARPRNGAESTSRRSTFRIIAYASVRLPAQPLDENGLLIQGAFARDATSSERSRLWSARWTLDAGAGRGGGASAQQRLLLQRVRLQLGELRLAVGRVISAARVGRAGRSESSHRRRASRPAAAPASGRGCFINRPKCAVRRVVGELNVIGL
jgi:hypothetical protein